MASLPKTDKSLLIRLDWSNDARWIEIVKAATDPYEDGFTANLEMVDDSGFEGMDAVAIAKFAANEISAACIFIVDAETIKQPDSPILCIGLRDGDAPFRVIPSGMWSVENNLAIANMDYADFAGAVGKDGVFRGFG